MTRLVECVCAREGCGRSFERVFAGLGSNQKYCVPGCAVKADKAMRAARRRGAAPIAPSRAEQRAAKAATPARTFPLTEADRECMRAVASQPFRYPVRS